MTIDEQRAYLRRCEIGWKAANDDQAAGARARSETEKWAVADELQQMAASLTQRHEPPPGDPSEHGLVVQQRYFMRAIRRS